MGDKMPTASVKGFKNYRKLKDKSKAKDFQKVKVENWLNHNLQNVPLSDI